MSEPLTAAGLREKLENNVAEAVESGLWDWGGWCDTLDLLLASTAARAVDEALSVERVAEALIFLTPTRDHGQLCPVWVRRAEVLSKAPQSHAQRRGPIVCDCFVRRGAPLAAAALVAHLRGPRPEGKG